MFFSGPDTPDICQYPADVGPCADSIQKWYYDERGHVCEPFIYGGCSGNVNRYDTQSDCELACREGESFINGFFRTGLFLKQTLQFY